MTTPILNQAREPSEPTVVQNIDVQARRLPDVNSFPPLESLVESMPYTLTIIAQIIVRSNDYPHLLIFLDGTHLPTLTTIQSYFKSPKEYDYLQITIPEGGSLKGSNRLTLSVLLKFIQVVCGYTLINSGDGPCFHFERHAPFDQQATAPPARTGKRSAKFIPPGLRQRGDGSAPPSRPESPSPVTESTPPSARAADGGGATRGSTIGWRPSSGVWRPRGPLGSR